MSTRPSLAPQDGGHLHVAPRATASGRHTASR
jgi:hypothetical protein